MKSLTSFSSQAVRPSKPQDLDGASSLNRLDIISGVASVCVEVGGLVGRLVNRSLLGLLSNAALSFSPTLEE